MLLSAVASGSPNLNGQYWFISISIDVDTNVPWSKRGTVTIASNQWEQQWEDQDGNHELSSALTTSTLSDGSININFKQETYAGETYNIAFNGNLMVHAGTVLGGGGEGIDIFARKATNLDVNDVLGDHTLWGHFLTMHSDSCIWGNATFDPNGDFIASWKNDQGIIESDIGNWILHDVNALIDISGPTLNPDEHAELYLGEGGIVLACHVLFDEGRDKNDIGYNVFIKKADQLVTTAEIEGTYQIRFLETGPGLIPYTCSWGTGVIEAVDDTNVVLSLDAYYSNGEHDVNSISGSIGPGNELHLDDESVQDAIISPDKNLIFIPEYSSENLPTRTDDDWIGGIFLVRTPAADGNIADLNGDGLVDAADMRIMIEHWGTDNQLCDIAPMPWGDGVVDAQDLIVLTDHLLEVYPPADTLDVNEADDGGQAELEMGQILVVTLESNPSTGYHWEISKITNSLLVQLGEPEFKPADTTEMPMVGTGGWEIFRFKAVRAGQTTLELVYHRSWEDAEPLKNFTIQVNVN